MRGVERTRAMLDAMARALPELEVDATRCEAALSGGALATDEVMRRVEAGSPFRAAYREVAAALGESKSFEPPPREKIISRRSSTGGLGNLGLSELKKRVTKSSAWATRERQRFDRAMRKLAGQSLSSSGNSSDRPSTRPPRRP
jgi:argininosuccinate lyase